MRLVGNSLFPDSQLASSEVPANGGDRALRGYGCAPGGRAGTAPRRPLGIQPEPFPQLCVAVRTILCSSHVRLLLLVLVGLGAALPGLYA